MIRFLTLLLLLLTSGLSRGNFLLPTELHPASQNPAMIASSPGLQMHFTGHLPYLRSQLFEANTGLTYRLKNHQFGLQYKLSGSKWFSRNEAIVNYGMRLSSSSSIGLRLGFTWQPGTEDDVIFSPVIGFGFYTELASNWGIGIQILQTIPNAQTEYRAPIEPIHLEASLSYSPKEELELHLGCGFHQYAGLNALLALSYQLNPNWLLRFHFQGMDNSFGLMLGWTKGKLDLRFQFSYGLQLGSSPSVSISKWP